MAELERRSIPVVIERLPVEIDMANAEQVKAQLRAGFDAGVIVVADMTLTTFCDSVGTQVLLTVARQAQRLDSELRIASPARSVLRVWQILAADRVLKIYPTVAAAADASTHPDGQWSVWMSP